MSRFSNTSRFFAVFISLVFCVVGVGQAQTLSFSGLVVENGSQQPVEFATIKALDKNSGSLVAGTTTDLDGRFQLQVPSSNVELEVTFIGFSPKRISSFSESEKVQDLGTITLEMQGELLDDVIVTGERSTTEFKLDRRVFNVGKDISSTGVSALEVLNNVPSVTVSIEGDIALRGSTGVQILIDGKPSVLAKDGGTALGSITADMIESIEVITNPSAKYNAEGTSGILNIVLKKEEKRGLSGSVSVNGGIPDNHSLGLSVNSRTEKWNLFGQAGIGYRGLPRLSTSENRDLLTNTSVFTDGESTRNELYYNLILGTDYHINKQHVVSLTGFYAFEDENNDSETNYEIFDATQTLTDSWTRNEDTEADNPKYQYEFNYSFQIDPGDKDHKLLFSALGSSFQKDQSSEFSTISEEGTPRFGDQRTSTNFGQNEYTFKADYSLPVNEQWSVESGAQYVLNDVGNDFQTEDKVGNDYVLVPEQTDRFEWEQGVLAVYGTAAYEGEKWGIMGGLRFEQTEVNTLLETTGEENDNDYSNFFPTLHTSYKLTETASVQAGYSRRVFRPRLWDLNPFFNLTDNFNVRTGNPDLQPEFTDSYEVTGIFLIGELSLNSSVYHRYTTDVVERIRTFDEGVTTLKPINLGTTGATGVELNAKYRPKKWLTLNTDLNYNYFNRKANFDSTSYDFNADVFSGRLVTKWELPADFDLEVSGRFESNEKTIQGVEKGQAYMDLGLRKKLLKGKIVSSLSVRDVFYSRRGITETFGDDFYIYSTRRRPRMVTLGLSYGFGKGEAMEFTGRRR